MIEPIYNKRLPEINEQLAKAGRKTINLGQDLESSAQKVKALIYYEACQELGIPCHKDDRCVWLLIRWGMCASSVEQVLRTAVKTTGTDYELSKDKNGQLKIETIDWLIYNQNRDRRYRKHKSPAEFDEIIASQNHICWGYINGDGVHHLCNTPVEQGNGNTEQGHQPGVSQDLIVAQCKSCNRKQTWGDNDRGVYD